VRIEVNPGGLETPGFDGIAQEIGSAGQAVSAGLATASGAAGDPLVASAINELLEVATGAGSAAVLSVGGLAKAVAKAGIAYNDNEAAICRAETLP
jgi:hypothetical protein